MGTLSDDIRRLLEDCELFVSSILQDENLSRHASETRQILLKNFRVVHTRNPQEFPFRSESRHEDSSDDNHSNSLGRSAPSDDLSVASDYQEEGSLEYFKEIPTVAAQELGNILKQGYLEKKRRDHSFLRMEWQKRWCVLNNTIFYYFGSEKDKQQKGSFYINGYRAELVPNLRKDSKKNACFEMIAPGRRSYQFTASSTREAREWVDQINFVLKDLTSTFIPFDDDEEEEEEEEEETYDDIERAASPPPRPMPVSNPTASHGPLPPPAPISHRTPEAWRTRPVAQEEDMLEEEEEDEEDIYEVLPEDDLSDNTEDGADNRPKSAWSEYANYYQGLWDCEADKPDELAFQRGDLIYILSKEYNIHGWWVGELGGNIGIVPKEYLHPAYII
ncbi:src kinase-associated phosphoprotein 1 [Alosa sapidissima]|uniref:src kinase-associated phosphoprotein 1 n=1 Tax=Alosa sapidissima TaxID=34773 RepID=UPI001C09BE06|nr:src kinase-associated phosphoprotein 1 [Alosa sapidissima]XP_041938476.1 src kinase-associated phosphoprotein 1 [Alosa sapidissima]